MSRRLGAYIACLALAVLLAIIAGQTAALLHAPALIIGAWAGGTFVAVLTLAISSYKFIWP